MSLWSWDWLDECNNFLFAGSSQRGSFPRLVTKLAALSILLGREIR